MLATPYLITLVGGVVFYALIVELSFLLTGAGLDSPAAIGGVSALMSVATAAGSIVFARLSHRTPRTLLPVEFVVSAVGFGLVFASGTVPVIAVGAVIAGFGTGMMLPTLLTWVINRLEFEQRGRGTGLWTGTLFVGEFLCPLFIAAVGAGVGGLRPAIGVLCGVALLMALVSAFLTRRSNVPLNITQQ